VLYKQYPPSDPLVVNAIGLSIAPVFLLTLSILFGETRSLPSDQSTWIAVSYLILIGTVVLFYFYLFVLERWTASATSYAFLLSPVSTVLLASWLTDELISTRFLLGGALVILGVWLGAFLQPKKENRNR